MERLAWVLAGRRPQPWGQRLGLQSATITRMMRDGHLPTAKFLERIQRAENLSLSWLLTGVGPPYLALSGTPHRVAESLRATLAQGDPEWNLIIGLDRGRMALILYRDIHIESELPAIVESRIFGGIGLGGIYREALLADELALFQGPRPVWAVHMGPNEWEDLAGGWTGTWQLFGEPPVDEPSFGTGHRIVGSPTQLRDIQIETGDRTVGEASAAYEYPPEVMDAYLALNPRERRQAVRVLRALREPRETHIYREGENDL